MKRTSKEFATQFQSLTNEVQKAIIDLMTEYGLNRLEIDIENRESHEIGYHTIYSEWQSEVISRINLISDGTLELINQWDEVLQNDGVAESEWVVILEMVEEQIEKDYNIEVYIQNLNKHIIEVNRLAIVTKIENDKHWSDLVSHYGINEIFNACQYGQKAKDFSFLDSYFYYNPDMRILFSFNTIQDLKNHFDLKNN